MLGKGNYYCHYHDIERGMLYDINPDGKIVAWVNLSPGGGGGGGSLATYNSNAMAGNTHQGYSVSANDYSSWQVGEHSGASWQGLSYSYNAWQSWSPTSYTTVLETSFSENWGNWSNGPGYDSSFGHSETTFMRDVYSVSYHNGAVTFGNYHYEARDVYDYSSYRSGEFGVDRQNSTRTELVSGSEVSFGQDGVSSFAFLSLQEDSFDFSRVQIGNDVSINEQQAHSSLYLNEWESPNGQGHESVQSFETSEFNAQYGDGFAAIQQSSFQMMQVDSASQFLLG